MIATARRRVVFVAGARGRRRGVPAAAALAVLAVAQEQGRRVRVPAALDSRPTRRSATTRFVLTQTQVPWYLWNSVKVAVLATLATLAVGVPAAYVLSRERFRGARPLMAALLAVQMVSPVVLLVPIYGVIERLGLIDTHAGLILVYAAMQVPFTVWVLKNFFDAVPPSIFEAARLDGASRARTLWSIALPLVAPGPRRDRDLQPRRVLVGVRAGAGAARLAGALHHPARPLQLPERLRDRVAAASPRPASSAWCR